MKKFTVLTLVVKLESEVLEKEGLTSKQLTAMYAELKTEILDGAPPGATATIGATESDE